MELKLRDMVLLDDIDHNGYCFSDGCGVMGCTIRNAVHQQLELKRLPSAIQVRICGVKGMLSYDPGFERSHGGALIGVRHSMVKFKSAHRVLEIKKVARKNTGSSAWGRLRTSRSNNSTNRHHCTLFQQLAFVLSSVGLPDLVFERLQRQYLCRLVYEGYFGKEVPRRVLQECKKTPVELLLFTLLLQNTPRAPWACTACTFENRGERQRCEMCNTPAPPRFPPDFPVMAAAMSTKEELGLTVLAPQKVKSKLVSVLKSKRHKGHVPCEQLILLQASPR